MSALFKDVRKPKDLSRRISGSRCFVKPSGESGKQSWKAVNIKHANQQVSTTVEVGEHDRRFTSIKHVSKLTTGLLLTFRGI